MADDDWVKFSRNGNVAKIEMVRPAHNLIEARMIHELSRAFARAVEEDCRSVLLASGLRHFCAGADLGNAIAGEFEKIDVLGLLHEMEELPIPIVVAVHGLALGGGFEIALGCDLILAADTAQIGLVETSLGLIPLMGGISRVAARAGVARAKEMTLLGRRYSASTLEQWGVINQVVPADSLHEAAMALAQQLASGPTMAYRAIRQLVNQTISHGVESADELSPSLAAEIWRSNDVKAGLEAFRKTGTAAAVFSGS